MGIREESGRARPAACRVVAGVLCGGDSRRMGVDKAGIEWFGQSLLDHSAGVAATVSAEVYLLGGGSSARWRRLADHSPGAGPLAGIAALAQAEPVATLMVIAVDQPLVDRRGLEWLLDRRHPDRELAMGLVGGRLQPLPMVLEPGAFPVLRELAAAGAGPRALVERVAATLTEVPASLAWTWQDADTPDQLDHLRRLQASHRISDR